MTWTTIMQTPKSLIRLKWDEYQLEQAQKAQTSITEFSDLTEEI